MEAIHGFTEIDMECLVKVDSTTRGQGVPGSATRNGEIDKERKRVRTVIWKSDKSDGLKIGYRGVHSSS